MSRTNPQFRIIHTHLTNYYSIITSHIPRQSQLSSYIRHFSSKPDESDDNVKNDRLSQIILQVIDSKPRKPTKPISKEEAEKRYNIGRNYVIGKFKKHNEINHDLACKIKMKKHAIQMIPKQDDSIYGYLKEEALKVSIDGDCMPPFQRPIAVDTPPIKGFDPNKFILEEEE